MRYNHMAAMVAMASLGSGGMFGHHDRYNPRPRDFTIEEIEEQAVQSMIRKARFKRRQTENARLQEINRQRQIEAARIEELRPKSRQELRARERSLGNYSQNDFIKAKDKSEFMKNLVKASRKKGRR
jgi:hypothetical protein